MASKFYNPNPEIKQRQEKKRSSVLWALEIIFLILGVLANLSVFQIFKMDDASKLICSLLLNTVATAIGLYLIWSRPNRATRPICIHLSVLAIVFVWLKILGLPYRVMLLSYTVLIVLAISCSLLVFFKYKEDLPLFETISPLFLLLTWVSILAYTLSRFSFLNDGAEIKFIIISVIFGAIISAASYPVIKKYQPKVKTKKKLKEQKQNALWALFCVFLSSAIILFFAISTVNISFDPSKPEAKRVFITDTVYTGGKNHRYSFVVNLDGNELWLDTSRGYFNSKKAGDSIEINIYKGALGEPYAIINTEK